MKEKKRESNYTFINIMYLQFRNASNFLFKLFAWVHTGSHSMFSECIHSAADTCNQLILAYGIHKSVQVKYTYMYIYAAHLALHSSAFVYIRHRNKRSPDFSTWSPLDQIIL